MKDTEKKLEALSGIADEAFGGLHAAQSLKNSVLERAEGKRKPSFLAGKARLAATVTAGVLVVAAVCTFTLSRGGSGTKVQNDTGAPLLMAAEYDEENLSPQEMIRRISTVAAGSIPMPEGSEEKAEVRGNVEIKNGSAPAFRSLWDRNSLIAVNGQYYCLLTSPSSVSASLKGEALGNARFDSTLPASFGVYTNCLEDGAAVYGVKGMQNTAVMCEMGGRLRVFQRVSLNGNGILGSETLADTLKGSPVRLALSGTGELTGSAAREAWRTLLGCAVFSGNGTSSSSQTLLCEMDNGVTLQLFVSGSRVMGCGTWSCPEFFDLFGN